MDTGDRPELREAAYVAAEQRAIADISRLALRGAIDDILGAATDAALTLIGAQCASIVRPDPGNDTLSPVAYSGPAPRPVRLPAGPRSQPGYAYDTESPVVCADREQETRFATDTMASRDLRSGVSVPISGDDGPWGVLTVHSAAARDYSAQEVTFLGTVCDVLSAAIRRIELENHLRHLSQHDPLTGLPNRTLVHDRLGRLLAEPDAPVAVFLVDFDNFKSINDHFGHDIGDVALVAVAQRLRDAVSSHVPVGEHSVARLGGDEFLVVSTDIDDAAAALATAESMTAILRVPLTIEGRTIPLSASIGIALSENGIQSSALVHRADIAMYRAKSSAAGSYALYDADDEKQARHHLTMSTDLRSAIENDRLALRYRAVTDTASGIVSSFAAQPIWEHPVLGHLDATEFVTTAETTGLVDALGAWVLHGACTDAVSWPESVTVRVDLLPTQIRHPGFVSAVRSALTRTGLPPQRLVVSVPESALTPPDDPLLHSVLTELHGSGVGLLLDNSSGGHSSIRNLEVFHQFDYFQLDSGDVGATFREHSVVVLQAVVALIHAIGAQVVAGGIDSPQHLIGVTMVGCDFAMSDDADSVLTASQAARLLFDGPV